MNFAGESQGRRLLLWKNHQFVEPVRRFDAAQQITLAFDAAKPGGPYLAQTQAPVPAPDNISV